MAALRRKILLDGDFFNFFLSAILCLTASFASEKFLWIQVCYCCIFLYHKEIEIYFNCNKFVQKVIIKGFVLLA